mgnify:CR=1 FL=1
MPDKSNIVYQKPGKKEKNKNCCCSTLKKGVQKIFSQVVEKYELINHLLTWGLDVHWRKKAAKLVEPQPGQKWLDVCTGTGEMVTALARKAERTSFDSKKVRAGRKNLEDRRNQPPFSLGSQPGGLEEAEALVAEDPLLSSPALFVALDFCLAMLPYLRETKVPYLSCPLHLVQADVRRLPFSEGVFEGELEEFYIEKWEKMVAGTKKHYYKAYALLLFPKNLAEISAKKILARKTKKQMDEKRKRLLEQAQKSVENMNFDW